MDIRPNDLQPRDFYRILVTAVAPRPIAWVSTVSLGGHVNLAQFSFFNVVSGRPPILGFSPAPKSGCGEKDTLRNIRETGEFVVNMVTFELAEAMNLTSGEYDHEVDEFAIGGVTAAASRMVKAPRVAESPVNFECKLNRIIDFGEPDVVPTGHLVLGEIVSVRLGEEILSADGKLDESALDLIGRMGGLQYSRTRERFELARPAVKK